MEPGGGPEFGVDRWLTLFLRGVRITGASRRTRPDARWWRRGGGGAGEPYFKHWQHVGGLQAEGAQENNGGGVGGVESLHEVDGGHHGQVVALAFRLVLQQVLNGSCKNKPRVNKTALRLIATVKLML